MVYLLSVSISLSTLILTKAKNITLMIGGEFMNIFLTILIIVLLVIAVIVFPKDGDWLNFKTFVAIATILAALFIAIYVFKSGCDSNPLFF